jgi:hypothetical protein
MHIHIDTPTHSPTHQHTPTQATSSPSLLFASLLSPVPQGCMRTALARRRPVVHGCEHAWAPVAPAHPVALLACRRRRRSRRLVPVHLQGARGSIQRRRRALVGHSGSALHARFVGGPSLRRAVRSKTRCPGVNSSRTTARACPLRRSQTQLPTRRLPMVGRPSGEPCCTRLRNYAEVTIAVPLTPAGRSRQ